jgi:hypothetical protein
MRSVKSIVSVGRFLLATPQGHGNFWLQSLPCGRSALLVQNADHMLLIAEIKTEMVAPCSIAAVH